MTDGELSAVVERRDSQELSQALTGLHAADIAAFMTSLRPEESDFVFSALPDAIAAVVLDELGLESKLSLLGDSAAARISSLVEHLEIDDAAELVSDLPGEQSAEVLANLNETRASEIQTALGYAENTAGRLMTTTYVSLDQSMPARQAVSHVRAQVAGPGELFYIYVIDAVGRLVGVVSIRALVLAAESERIGDFCDRNVVRVSVQADREEVARTMAKYDLLLVPVVDDEDRLIGTVTIDDALDVLTEEATEDLLRLSGSFEPATDRTRSLDRVFYRLPW